MMAKASTLRQSENGAFKREGEEEEKKEEEGERQRKKKEKLAKDIHN